jgi:hypothetical protein
MMTMLETDRLIGKLRGAAIGYQPHKRSSPKQLPKDRQQGVPYDAATAFHPNQNVGSLEILTDPSRTQNRTDPVLHGLLKTYLPRLNHKVPKNGVSQRFDLRESSE